MLFLPLPSSLRVKAKAFIDVFLQRSAKGLGALLLLPVTFGLMTAVQAGWIALVLIALWFVAAGAAYRAYVTSFRAGLKQRSVDTVVPIDLAAHHRERGQGAVVGLRHVAAAAQLGDLGVVHLDGIAVDIGHVKPGSLERIHDEGLVHRLG